MNNRRNATFLKLYITPRTLAHATVRMLAGLQALVCGSALVLVIVPYLVHGMYAYDFRGDIEHLRTPSPLDYFPYNQGSVGEALHTLGFSMYIVTMFALPISTLICLICLWLSGQSQVLLRIWWVRLALIISLAFVLLVWSPIGGNILGWIFSD